MSALKTNDQVTAEEVAYDDGLCSALKGFPQDKSYSGIASVQRKYDAGWEDGDAQED